MTQSQDRRATSGVGFHNTGSGCSPCFRGWACRSGGPTLTGRPAKFHGDVPCNKWGRSAWNSALRGLTWHWKRDADTKSSKVLGLFHYRKKTIQKAWFDNRFLCWEQLRSGVPMARYQRRKLWPPSVHASHSVGPFLEEPIQHFFFWTRSVGLNNCSRTFASWETRTPRPSALFFPATPSRYLRNQRNMFFPSSLYLSLVFPFYSCFFFLRCQACKVQCRVTFKCLRCGKPIHLLVILIFGVSIFKHVVGRCTPTGIALRSRTTCRKHNGWKSFSLPWSACLLVWLSQVTFIALPTMSQRHCGHPDGNAATTRVFPVMLPTGFCFEPGQMVFGLSKGMSACTVPWQRGKTRFLRPALTQPPGFAEWRFRAATPTFVVSHTCDIPPATTFLIGRYWKHPGPRTMTYHDRHRSPNRRKTVANAPHRSQLRTNNH